MSRTFPLHLFAHAAAACLALTYAWQISQSDYLRTGLQFITPLLIIMAVHLGWLALTQGLHRGFASIIYRRSAQTAVIMAIVVMTASITAPMPARAGMDDVIGQVLTVLFCGAIIAAIVGVVGFFIYVIVRLFKWGISSLGGGKGPGNNSRLFDVGSLVATGLFLGLASLEGLPNSYAFATGGQATASYSIDADIAETWQTMETATSPAFPLPGVLMPFPQPVEVSVDEGTALGATRKVRFQGREGAGYLTLRVVERTDRRAVFDVVSDTTPYAGWIAYQRLTYEVRPEGSGTRLDVTLSYDRRLSPSWFFTPMMKGAAYLAMDVLARDVKTRAES